MFVDYGKKRREEGRKKEGRERVSRRGKERPKGEWEKRWAPGRKKLQEYISTFLELLSLQVLICANPKGMKIKSGSMGKASPPYDVQVGSLAQLLLRLGSKRRAKCMSWSATAGSAGGVVWLHRYPDTALWSLCQIVDDEGNILPPGQEGNIAVRVRPTRPFCFFSCYLVSGREWPFSQWFLCAEHCVLRFINTCLTLTITAWGRLALLLIRKWERLTYPMSSN